MRSSINNHHLETPNKVKFLLHHTDGYDMDYVVTIHDSLEAATKHKQRLESREVKDPSLLEERCLPEWLNVIYDTYYYITSCEFRGRV